MSYSPLPTDPATPLLTAESPNEKAAPKLARQISATPLRLTPPSPLAQHSRLYLFTVLGFVGLLALVGGGAAGGWTCVGRSVREGGHAPPPLDVAGERDARFAKLVKREEAEASPTYSTSTYANGETSTFVYTTRPIVSTTAPPLCLPRRFSDAVFSGCDQVNPQGYTIGTLTGYQHVSSTTSPSPTANRVRAAAPQKPPPTPSPTYSTSTYSNGNTSTFVYTTRPIVNPIGVTIGTLTGYVPAPQQTDIESSSVNSTSSTIASNSTASSTAACTAEVVKRAVPTSAPLEMRFDDSNLLHRRGINFELEHEE
ncbi:hypothetical protein RQP46_002233 [Phenoliferia psychrophenolica]